VNCIVRLYKSINLSSSTKVLGGIVQIKNYIIFLLAVRKIHRYSYDCKRFHIVYQYEIFYLIKAALFYEEC